MKSRRLLLTLWAACLLPLSAQRETVELDFDWLFHLGDEPAAARPDFDDTAWRRLDVPHDWAWEAPYSPTAAQADSGGYKPGGIGWYRRAFDVPLSWANRRVRVEFDGVYMDSTVWLNGVKIGAQAYGYVTFGFDLTPHLRSGRNVITVRVDNSREPSARWYHGCGIYAPVRLVVTDPVHVAPAGVVITTPEIGRDAATVRVVTTLAAGAPAGAVVTNRLLDPAGVTVAEVSGPAGAQTLRVATPLRWDPENPVLYTAVTEVRLGDRLVDVVQTRFGIREIAWKSDTGFWLNGRVVKLRGVADHLESGPVGAAVPTKLLRWKLSLLKAMGVNAIRTAHNPQVPAFYALCDELGLMVMDEIFDGWSRKAPEDYGARFFADHWEQDVRAWVRRNRNHPSVVIYSVGNETRGKVGADLVRVVREEDATRPVTSGHSASELMDVYGVNGNSEKQSFFAKPRPSKPFIATEAPHTWQVRGYYRTRTWWRDGYPNRQQDPFPLPDLTEKEIFSYDWAPASARTSPKQVFNSSYDNATVRISARKNWELMRDLPWFAGHFRWTGFDYVGEAGYVHGGWPFRAFMGGALDLAGFEKDLFFFYQSQWTESPMVHLLPHWTHPRLAPGTVIPVWAYSNADEVELFLNGRSLGRDRPGRAAEEMQCEWFVPWEAGTLEAVAYRGGSEVARTRHITAGPPAALRVDTDNRHLLADGRDVAIVTVAQIDAAGHFHPFGENAVTFRLEGPARLLSLENGNPVDTTPNVGVNTRRTFFGLTRAFVSATRESGDVAVVAGAVNGERRQLTSREVAIDVRRIALRGAPQATAAWEIHYTTDGSEPAATSARYTGSFSVALGTTVRALVREHGRDVLRLKETFATDVGLHWPAPGEKTEVAIVGMQAELAVLAGGATVQSDGVGDHGSAHVAVPTGGSVEWYQENDGSAGRFQLDLRWRADAGVDAVIEVNGQLFPLTLTTPADSWRTATLKVPLQAGANRLHLRVISGGPLRVDDLTVTAN